MQKGCVYMPKSASNHALCSIKGAGFDFELLADDMQTLDNLTTPAAQQAFEQLYRKCVNRVTSEDDIGECQMNTTVD